MAPVDRADFVGPLSLLACVQGPRRVVKRGPNALGSSASARRTSPAGAGIAGLLREFLFATPPEGLPRCGMHNRVGDAAGESGRGRDRSCPGGNRSP